MAGAWEPPKKPNERFLFIDSVPEDAKHDVDFEKAVNELQDQQASRGGWLFARGAFDKGDLLYLKDEADKRKHVEEAMEDQERTEFFAARLRLEEEEAARRAHHAAKAAALKKEADGARKKRPAPVVKVVAVQQGEGAKRQRPDTASSQQEGASGAKADASEPGLAQEEAGDGEESEGDGGLGALLGGYASSSDNDDDRDGRDTSGREGGAMQPDPSDTVHR